MKYFAITLTLLLNSVAIFGQYEVIFDSTFNGDGNVVLPYEITAPEGLFLQSDGKLIMLGANWINNDSSVFTVLRLNADGSLDQSYNNTGINDSPTLFGYNSYEFGALLPNNDLVIGGPGDYSAGQSSLILHKYLENGAMDVNFGNSGAVTFTLDPFFIVGADLQIYKDSSILVLLSGGYSDADTSYSKIFLCSFNPDGSIDSSFAVNGVLDIPCSAYFNAQKLVLSNDGSIYIKGTAGDGHCLIVKLNADLTVDSGFNIESYIVTSVDNIDYCAIAVDEDSKLIVTASNYDLTFRIFRFMPNGTLDNSFSKDGVLNGFINLDASDILRIIEQPDGKLLFQCRWGVIAMRVNPNGTLDYSFDLDGFAEKVPSFDYTTSIVSNSTSGMILQPDGKMLFVTEAAGSDLIRIIRVMTRP